MGFFELTQDGKLAPGLLTFLAILHASSTEFAKWMSIPECELQRTLQSWTQARVLRHAACRRTLHRSLRKRFEAYSRSPVSAAEDREEWNKVGTASSRRGRDAIGLRL